MKKAVHSNLFFLFPRMYYNTENIVIAINGKVDAEDVFEALQPVEKRAFQRGAVSSPLVARPFSTDYPQLEEDQDAEVKLPETLLTECSVIVLASVNAAAPLGRRGRGWPPAAGLAPALAPVGELV